MKELTREDIFNRTADTIVRDLIFPRSMIKESTDIIIDLGADSMDIVELAMAIEDEFNIELPDEMFDKGKIKTVGDVVDYVMKEREG